MEIYTWLISPATWFILILLFFLSFFCLRPRSGRLNPPPGPKPLPVIGNLNVVGSLPHLTIHELSQKYGPIMQLQFGSVPVVVGTSSEMARQFLKIQDLNFASRPKTTAAKYTAYDQAAMSFAPYGPYWQHARKIFVMELFSAKKLDSYEYIRVQESRALMSKLDSSCGDQVILRDYFSELPLNIVSRIVLGKHLSKTDGFKHLIDEWFLLNGAFNIGDFIPWINFLDLQGYVKRMKALGNEMDVFLEKQINEHIARKQDPSNEFIPKNMLDTLLQLAESPTSALQLSRENVKGLVWDVFAGGTETTTTTIEWAMSEILKQPRILDRATQELDRVVGRDRWVEEADIPNLPYIKYILYETMRMHPVSTILAPHIAQENCKIHGYDIVRGSHILLSLYSMGRDPSVWDEPNEFRPERFIGKDIDIKGQHFELLPFGSGRRMCPGNSLGLKLIEPGLANFLHGFTWKLPNQMTPSELDMEEVWGLTVGKKIPLVAIPQARLPPHMYSM